MEREGGFDEMKIVCSEVAHDCGKPRLIFKLEEVESGNRDHNFRAAQRAFKCSNPDNFAEHRGMLMPSTQQGFLPRLNIARSIRRCEQ